LISNRKSKYAVLILAAGKSNRLGRPKQLVKIDNKYLLEKTIEMASQLKRIDLHIILGAYSDQILKSIDIKHPFYFNPDWKDGMGSSIAYGIDQIKDMGYKAVVLCVCDQPYLETHHIEQLITAYGTQSGFDIIQSKYDQGNGPPVLFGSNYFDQLAQMKGDQGAKYIVNEFPLVVTQVSFPKGNIDIDREEDLDL